MARTIEQKIAEAQNKLNRLRTQKRASETRRKIIVGSVVISNALQNPASAKRLAATLRQTVTREVDQKEIETLLEELDAKAKTL